MKRTQKRRRKEVENTHNILEASVTYRHFDTYISLGLRYCHGRGVEKNPKLGATMYNAAIKKVTMGGCVCVFACVCVSVCGCACLRVCLCGQSWRVPVLLVEW